MGRLEASAAHDGATLSLRLVWADPTRDDRITDLDRFTDAAAVMFPLAPGATPFSMGAPGKPVNAWLWRAEAAEPFDVLAEGYATSRRRPASTSGLRAAARHGKAVDARLPAASRHGRGRLCSFQPGVPSEIAFAIWDGSGRDRSAQKAFSAGLFTLDLEA